MPSDSKLVVEIDADTRGFDDAMHQVTQSSKQFGNAFSTSLSQAIIKGKNFEDTLRSIGSRLADVALNQALKPFENLVAQLFTGLTSSGIATPAFADGGVINANGPVPFAKGGTVSSPSYFNYEGGTGIMGEAGAEAILPLARGPDGKLGVASNAQNSNPVNIVFNVSATDTASFRRSESQITTMLARAVSRGNRKL